MFPDSSNYIGEPKTNNRKVGIYIKWKATVYTVIKQTKYDGVRVPPISDMWKLEKKYYEITSRGQFLLQSKESLVTLHK